LEVRNMTEQQALILAAEVIALTLAVRSIIRHARSIGKDA